MRLAQAMARPKRKSPTEAAPDAHGGAAAPIEPAPAGESRAETVCLGRIVGAHGVRGIVRVQSYAVNPDDLTAYGALSDASGARRFTLSVTGHVKGLLLARIEGVDDRNAREALRGTDLHIARAALPTTEGEEFYHVDLLGLRAENAEGDALGQVSAIHDHGAGPIIEIQPPDGPSTFLPFTAGACARHRYRGRPHGRRRCGGGRLVTASPRDDGPASAPPWWARVLTLYPRSFRARSAPRSPAAASIPASGGWKRWTSAALRAINTAPSTIIRSAAGQAW